MKIVANYSPSIELKHLDEILFCPTQTSRHGVMPFEDMLPALNSIKAKKVLVWDILMVQKDFDTAKAFIEKIDIQLFDAIRVQDLGALEYLKVHFPHIPVQFNAETGYHNAKSLAALCESHD